MRTKAAVPGFVTLFIGVALLTFTFASAYLFLKNDPTIIGSSDLVSAFGEAFAPLIVTCIRIMYLGVMGWIGSVLTVRGVQLVTQPKLKPTSRVNMTAKPLPPKSVKTPRASRAIKASKTSKTKKSGKVTRISKSS